MSGSAAAAAAATKATRRSITTANSTNDMCDSIGGRGADRYVDKYLLVRPYLIEVAGSMEDDKVRAITRKLHAMRNRYFPILRTMFSLAASPVPEGDLLGREPDGEATGHESAVAAEWLRRPHWAVSGNKTRSIIPRLHPSPASEDGTCSSPAPMGDMDGEAQFDAFMAYRFLPLAITHNFLPLPRTHRGAPTRETKDDEAPPLPSPSFSEADVEALVVRHYVHESSRTASFLVADTESKHAVLIDPSRYSLTKYETDLAFLGLCLTHIVVTHCFVDLALCVEELRRRHPGVRVVSGVDGEPAPAPTSVSATPPPSSPPFRARTAGEAQVIQVSARLSLVAVTVPSFSPESQLVELKLNGTLIALFSGTTWGTDAAPRADLLEAFDLLTTGSPPQPMPPPQPASHPFVVPEAKFYSSPDAMRVAQRNLKKHFYDRYLFPPPLAGRQRTSEEGVAGGCAARKPEDDAGAQPNNAVFADEGRYDRVVLFPSHGGYSNVSNQLDLYWAIHLGDLKRMRHARAVVDTLASPEAYVAYARSIPPLPRPLLFQSNRCYNLCSLLSPPHPSPSQMGDREEDGATEGEAEHETGVRAPPSSSPYPPLLLDTRDAPDYHKVHLRGAINIPFSFPGADYGAKRAELWLQCLVLPTQPILLVVTCSKDKAEALTRVRAVSPLSSCIAAYTIEELLLPSSSHATAICEGGSGARASVDTFLSSTLAGAVRDGSALTVGDAVYFSMPFPMEEKEEEESPSAVPGSTRARDGTDHGKEALRSLWQERNDSGEPLVGWVACIGAGRAFARIDTPEKLAALDHQRFCSSSSRSNHHHHKDNHSVSSPGPKQGRAEEGSNDSDAAVDTAMPAQASTLVVDVRTPYEFKQGSHQHSVHLQLSELCALTTEATHKHALRHPQGRCRDKKGAVAECRHGDTSLATVLYNSLLETAIVAKVLPVGSTLKEVGSIVVYCAGGYRSLIAASLLRRALELAVDMPPATASSTATAGDEGPKDEEKEGAMSQEAVRRHLSSIPIVDVAGGAFTIMTHRPDLWQVKDRSIICIS